MQKCALLTMDTLDDFIAYDQVLDQPMAQCGWQTEHLSWRRKNVDWRQYKAAIIRSTWDYQEHVGAFVDKLRQIEQSGTVLLNSLAIVKWNINKKYLREVATKGAQIVSSLWLETFDFTAIKEYFQYFKTDQIVIKPSISANSDNTFWLHQHSYHKHEVILKESLKNRQLLVQPFIKAIVDEGEYSLFYFADKFSHAILKTPKQGDFRVQEEHGGQLQSIKADAQLLATAAKALQCVPEKVLYARIDLVKHQGSYQLMEIELIEPSLYFNLDQDSALRFAKAFANWMA
jgi:glutathione synthase/RimK-type ligase-like ATP-grasp enzyme